LRLTVAQQRTVQAGDEFDDDEYDDDEQVKALNEQELTALLAQIAADRPEWHLFFRFLAQTGLRTSEVVELRWKDVDVDARTVHVRRRFNPKARPQVGPPKSRYSRRKLRLIAQTAADLRRQRGGAGDGELVFTNSRGGRIDPGNLRTRVLKPAAVRAGLGVWKIEKGVRRAETWVILKTFRHTCATLLFARGWNAKQVQRWLGHHKASFTIDVYVHLLEDGLPEPVPFGEGAYTARTQTGRNEPKPGLRAAGE
jgi:integrase